MISKVATGVARTVGAARARVTEWRSERQRVALVPTLGALHDGHRALIEHARRQADRVVVSVFVNPKQFGPGEDFGAYPRPESEDLDLLRASGVDLLFAPPLEVMYPDGFATTVSVGGPLTTTLEGAHRPGHFDGVATVVSKLFIQIAPDLALFGEKDWQQLQVIKQLVRDLELPLEILTVPTVRDGEGLALSSRNAYLTPEQLAIARKLNRVLQDVASKAAKGDVLGARGNASSQLREAGFDSVDYVEIADAETMQPAPVAEGRALRVLAAARIGGTRLIDNFPVEPPT
ncbi:MAG: pantoate--beta-alanine ligase [Rhodospirillales bacterium]|nr:pantoate--beta-alanine ligase [Rhodospirillales bacterium]